MKNSTLELVTKIDNEGNVLERETYVTRPNITLSMVFECVDFLANLEKNSTKIEYHLLADIVTRIYDNQFTKKELMYGLHGHDALKMMIDQVVFVATGNLVDSIEIPKEAQKTTVSMNDHKNNLKAEIQKLIKKSDKDINEILNIPYHFYMDELSKEVKQKHHKESMLDAFMS